MNWILNHRILNKIFQKFYLYYYYSLNFFIMNSFFWIYFDYLIVKKIENAMIFRI